MAAFNAVDDNNDGIIGANQLGRVLKLLGENPTDAVLQVIRFFYKMFEWEIVAW